MASSTPDIPRTSSSSKASPSVSGSAFVGATSSSSPVRKYGGIAASFLILHVGSSAKINFIGGTDRVLQVT